MELMADDWQKRFFDEAFRRIDDGMSDLKNDVHANTKLTQQVSKKQDYTNGRVTKLEEKVFGEVKKQNLQPFLSDPKVRVVLAYTVLSISLTILFVSAAILKVDVTRFLP